MAIVLNQRLIQSHYVGGVFVDKSEYGNDGTPVNVPVFGTNHLGVANSATVFNGVDDLIDTGDDMIGVLPLTISAWIYLTGWGESNLGAVVRNERTLFRASLGYKRMQFYSDGATGASSATNSISLNIWQHVLVTRNVAGDETNIYIDGLLSGVADQDSGTPVMGDTNVFIGGRYPALYNFDGKISDVRIYNTVRTEAERTLIYEGGSQSAAGILTFNGGRSRTPTFVRAFSGELSFAGKVQAANPNWLYIPDYLNWMGTWDALVVYDDLDVVLHQDGDLIHAFVSKASHNVGNLPTTAYPWWTRLVQEQWMK